MRNDRLASTLARAVYWLREDAATLDEQDGTEQRQLADDLEASFAAHRCESADSHKEEL